MAAPVARSIGRYLLGGPIAVGGMASVHLGRLDGPVGFRRTVAIKRMLGAFASSQQAREMLIDEARLAGRVHHGNVVQTLDVVEDRGELFLVLEYVQGESLDHLLAKCREQGRRAPVRVVTAVLVGALRGLHAAHEVKGEDGQPLELVHRDLSPHNLIVDVNGVTRVLDFGVARARGRLQGTTDGQLKGKLAYLSPEQVHGEASRRSDLFTAGVVLWEALAGRQLFVGANEAALLSQVLLCRVPPLSSVGVDAPGLQAVLDRVLQREPGDRFATAAELADALEACGVATASEVAAWVKELAGAQLEAREALVRDLGNLTSAPVAAPVAPAPLPPARGLSPATALVVAALMAVVGVLFWRDRPVPLPVASVVLDAGVSTAVDAGVPEPAVVAAPSFDAGTVAVVVPPKRPPLEKKPPTRGGCTPPYVIDAQGVKRYKVECLE